MALANDHDPLEPVAELADVSLIRVTEGADGEPRLAMLETIRDYALERLQHDDDADAARRRHAEHYLALAEQAREQLDGPIQLAALDRLEAENDNLRNTKMTLKNGSGAIPALGYGTLIPDPAETRTATKAALDARNREVLLR